MQEIDPENLPDVKTSRAFDHAHSALIERFKRVAEDYEEMFPGRRLLVSCTYRHPDEQWRLYQKGRFGNKGPIVTYIDGRRKKSKHNHFPSRALDCFVLDGGKAVWDETYYYPLGPLASKYELVWGGYWSKFQDFPHLQLPPDVS